MSQSPSPSPLHYEVNAQPVPGYTLVRVLGQGSMGVVWLAETENGFERALKIIDLQQRGGRKEFRGLRTIKRRRLLQGNLLTLIDYWIKDAEGTFLPDADDSADDETSDVPQTRPSSLSGSTSRDLKDTSRGRGVPAVPRGTMGDVGDYAPAPSDAPWAGPPAKNIHRPVQLIVAMELGHKTLFDRLRECHSDRQPGISAAELLPYMEQSARGLDYLHREGILHRDVKPANIMLVGDVAKVCDYGLVISQDDDLRMTSNAFTLPYASPEAVSNHPLNGRTDQYSLAVTYVELRTGRWPYSSDTAPTVYSTKETGKYDLTRIRKRPVRSVLKRALATKPGDRFGTCSEFVKALTQAEQSRPMVALAARCAALLALLLMLGIAAALAYPPSRERVFAAIWPQSALPPELLEAIGRHEEGLKLSTTYDAAREHHDQLRPSLSELQAHLDLFDAPDPVEADVRLLQGRLSAGGNDWDQVQSELNALAGMELEADQRLLLDFLQLLAADHAWSPAAGGQDEVTPQLEMAQNAGAALQAQLSPWEKDLYRQVIARHGSSEAQRREGLVRVVRDSRSKNDIDAAVKSLKELETLLENATDEGGQRHRWQAGYERLHLDIARDLVAGEPSNEAWLAFDQRIDALRSQLGDLTAERAQLAGLRILVTTRFDPSRFSLDLPLADAFAELASATNQWSQLDAAHFSPSERQKLTELYAELGPTIVAASTPLPVEWRDRLGAIVAPDNLLALLTDRVAAQLQAQNALGLAATTTDLNGLVQTLNLSGSKAAAARLADIHLEADFAPFVLATAEPGQAVKSFAERALATGRPAGWLDRLLRLAEGNEAWAQAAVPELYVLLKRLPSGSGDGSTIADYPSRIASLSLAKYVTNDGGLSDPAVRAAIRKQIETLGADLPLAALLDAELWLEEPSAADGQNAAATQKRNALTVSVNNAIDRLAPAGGSANDPLRDYGQFLRARLDVLAGDAATSADSAVLLAWPEGNPTTANDWHTPRRTRTATDLLVSQGDRALALDDSDILHFHQLAASRVATAGELLEKAERLGCDRSDFRGLHALVLAVPAGEQRGPEQWQRIADECRLALADAAAGERLKDCRGLIEYVGALAISRSSADATPVQNRGAIASFARLLAEEQIFRDDSPRDSSDREVLEHVILPALAIGAPEPMTEQDRENLARAWGAKGRILERNEGLVNLPGVQAAPHADTYARAIQAAHDAYSRAQKLHPAVLYAGGYARTLLELPREDFDIEKQFPHLLTLVERYDPQGNSDDPSLLLAGAWVQRRLALRATDRGEQMQHLGESLRRYKLVEAATTADDPYNLRSMALVGASDTHVRAAFYTSIRSADEVPREGEAGAPADDVAPAEMTRYQHLRRALEYAGSAQAYANRRLPEEALLSEGNALEDLAYYCKLTENYPAAEQAFKQAAQETGLVRSNVYALTCLGRCQFRWARDAADIDGDPDRRRGKIREAHVSLQEAVAQAGENPASAAEARWWLAHTLFDRVTDGPGDLSAPTDNPFAKKPTEELGNLLKDVSLKQMAQVELKARHALLEAAWKESREAAALVDPRLDPATRLLYSSDAARMGAEFYKGLTNSGAKERLPEVTASLRTLVSESLRVVKQRPETFTPSHVYVLVAALHDVDKVNTAGSTPLKDYESLFDRPSDAWRIQFANLLLLEADTGKRDNLIKEAEGVAAQITDPRARDAIEGRCKLARADLLFNRELGKQILDGSSAAKLKVSLTQAHRLYMEGLKASARSADKRVVPNLEALAKEPLRSIELGSFEKHLSKLEAYQLREHIRANEDSRTKLCAVLLTACPKLKGGPPLSDEGKQVVDDLHDCLKSLIFIDKRLLVKYRSLLEELAKKL
ncbi:MAG: protein kinase [Pirellulaceae bacterium]